MSTQARLTLLCVMAATKGLYGLPFLRQAKDMGVRLLVLTNANALHLDWPRELLDGLFAVEDIFDPTLVRNTASFLAREERIDRIVGLGEYDIEIASALREHMRIPGMNLSTSYLFRDKLAMRQQARDLGLPVPEFVSILHRPSIHDFMQTVEGPWVLKPRTEASSNGIRKLYDRQAVWDAINGLGDEQSLFLLERFVSGTVYHVDSVVYEREIKFAAVHQYGTPILELHTLGGVYTSRAIRRGSPDETALQELNRQIIKGFGMTEGVTHIEYIKSQADGHFYFLEASARVGAGMTEEMIEAASGLNLWAEWAKIEYAMGVGTYALPKPKQAYAGVAICMTREEHVPLSELPVTEGVRYAEPKPYHVAAVVSSPDADQVETQVAELTAWLDQAFMTHAAHA